MSLISPEDQESVWRSRALATAERMAHTERITGRGSWIWEIKDGTVNWSDQMYRVFGYEPGSVEPSYEGYIGRIHPDDRAAVAERIQRCLEEHEPWEDTKRAIKSDGSEFLLATQGEVILNSSGEPTQMYGVCGDVTAKVEGERASAQLQTLVESSHDAIVVQDLEGKIVAWSPGATRVFGLDAGEVLGHLPDEFIEWEDYKDTQSVINRVLAGESKGSLYEGYRSRADGTRFKATIVTSPITENGGEVTGTACIIRDETEQDSDLLSPGKVSDEIDSLTGALSRWAFTEWLGEKMRQRSGVLVRLDLDNFRLVNEHYGNLGANQLLRGLTRTLRRNIAAGDALARLGGDEFAMVITPPGKIDPIEVAQDVLDRIRSHVEPIEGNTVTTTASLGVVDLSQTGATTAEELLAESDRALVEAEAHGKDRFVISGEIGPTVRANLFELGARLRSALADDRLELFLQPIVSTDDLEVVMYEALVRMREEDELVGPDLFLPAAENLGVIHEVDRVVVRKALDLLDSHKALRLTVNLSGKSLDDRNLLEMLSARLEARPQVAGRLVFEVTETSAVVDIDAARRFSQNLQGLGCDFALDDFGAGFGSFAYLKRVPSKYLKIDGQFVGPPRSKTDEVVIDSVVSLSRALGMTTVAEFVEDEATLQRIREAGVDLAQGYHLGRPAPVDETLAGRAFEVF